MADCRLYLITPPAFAPAAFASRLDAALSAGDVACVELRLAAGDDADWQAAIDALRPVAQKRGVAFLTSGRPALALETGCDGTALLDPAGYREARDRLGAGYIVGAWAGTSRHAAMVAGEAGADFIGLAAEPDLVGWWAELFEVPCVAGGAVSAETARALADSGADFLALGPDLWDDPDGPAVAIGKVAATLAG